MVGRQPNRRNFLTVPSLLVTPFASHLEAPRSQRLPVPSFMEREEMRPPHLYMEIASAARRIFD
jgi:hypothetical protein